MGFIAAILAGALIGWIASIIGKTNDQMGCLWNIGIGVVGAAIGRFIAGLVLNSESDYGAFSLPGLLFGIAGALLLVFLLRALGILKRD